MASGLPVITTNKVNIWREIKNAAAGEIIDCDAKALENALEKLINNPALRTQYAANGRQLVLQKYDWNIVINQLIEAYQHILSDRNMRKEFL